MRRRKRAPGGGRKAEGEFSRLGGPTSIRMPSDLREQLEKAAKERSRNTGRRCSFNQEVLTRLQGSFNQEGVPAMRALAFVIERIALEATGGRWFDPTDPMFRKSASRAKIGEALFDEWRTNPFHYRAFKLAVASLLTALEPKGDIRSPDWTKDIDRALAHDPKIKELMKRTYESPENFAAYIFSNIWRELNRNYPISKREQEFVGYGRGSVGAIMLADLYQMRDARRDLGLDAKEEKGK